MSERIGVQTRRKIKANAPSQADTAARAFSSDATEFAGSSGTNAAAPQGHSIGRMSVSPGRASAVQPKLTVGAADDQYEREADKVASQVMGMHSAPQAQEAVDASMSQEPTAQRESAEDEDELQMKPLASSISRMSAPLQRESAEDEDEVQMKPGVQREAGDMSGSFAVGSDVETGIASKKGGGSALPDGARSFMEPRFGADFSGVRVHTDEASQSLNRSIGARAFTTGSDIFFNRGEYDPGSSGGRQLLAHELTHVVQQTGGGVQSKRGGAQPKRNVQRIAQHGVQRAGSSHQSGCDCPSCNSVQPSIQRKLDPARKNNLTANRKPAIQRDPTNPKMDVDSKQFFKAKMKNASGRKLVDNIPSSGMGKFDAEYLPDSNQLLITVKLHFDFTGGWLKADELDFQNKFTQQVQTGWSGKYAFHSKKPGWEEFNANTVVRVQTVPKKDQGHYNVSVDAGGGRAMVGREGSKAGQTSGAMFYKDDVNAAPHKSSSIRCSIASHEAQRMKRILDDSHSTTVYFDEYSDHINDTGPLDRVATEVVADKLPGAPKVPLLAAGFATKKETTVGKGMFAKKNDVRADAAQRRATAVARHLKGKMPGYDVTETTHAAIAEEMVAAAKQKSKSKRKDTKAEGKRELAIAKEEAKLKSGPENHKVEIGVDQKFASSYKGDPYSVAVHEFGHMMGNPDEYFTYGPKTVDMRTRQLLESKDLKKIQEGINLREKDKAGKVDKSLDAERSEIQASYAALVESAGLEIPAFGPQTSSLMSAGTDLLPRHYVALWEALGRITDPIIKQSEWDMV